MFSYYGSKSKIVKLYNHPVYSKIIEPFAGSARYSLTNWEREIYLYDLNPVIIGIWRYLQNATKKDIESLPIIDLDFDLSKHLYLSEDERNLIGFLIADGVAKPAKKLTKKWFSQRPNKINHRIKNIIELLPKIKHWNIIKGSYETISNQKATWFIDPPYQVGGQVYPFSEIDYNHLLKWSLEREGQVIICENSNSSWVPGLQPLTRMKGANKFSVECVFYKNNDFEQLELFDRKNTKVNHEKADK